MIQEEKVGEREGGLGYVEVEMDAPGIGDLPVQFRVCGLSVWGWDLADEETDCEYADVVGV